MKNTFSIWLCTLALLLFGVTALAQAPSAIVLDASSLTPVNADPITGLALDPIGLDRSNRPCARIKIHISRMTPEQIAQIQVRTHGGVVTVMKTEVSYYGDGLIVELTAKPETKISLHHDEIGDSNLITVRLEGNKEYKMEAWCEVRQSVLIEAERPGAEVFLDGVFRGSIGDDNRLTIPDVTMGSHTLKFIYAEGEHSQDIFVSSADIFFPVQLSGLAESEEKADESEVEEVLPAVDTLLQDQIATEMVAQPEVPQVKQKPVKDGKTLLMASVGVSSPMTFGAMIGYVNRVGSYAKFRSNFDFRPAAYNCTSDGFAETGGYIYTSGRAPRYSSHRATAGLLVRLSKNIYPYFGAGYSMLNVYWEDNQGKWMNVTDYSFKGLAAEAGLTLKFGAFSLSAGASTTAFKHTEMEIGVGLMF